MKFIYKITYPNGKIYIGQDRTDSINCCPKGELIASDFDREERQRFTVTREIVWESDTASRSQVNKKEIALIREYSANDPAVGYNRWPKFRSRPTHS